MNSATMVWDWSTANASAAFAATLATLVLAGVSYWQARALLRRDALTEHGELALKVFGPLRIHLRETSREEPLLLEPEHAAIRLGGLSWRTIQDSEPALILRLPVNLRELLDSREEVFDDLRGHWRKSRVIAEEALQKAIDQVAGPQSEGGAVSFSITANFSWAESAKVVPHELWARDVGLQQWAMKDYRWKGFFDATLEKSIYYGSQAGTETSTLGHLDLVQKVLENTLDQLRREPTMVDTRTKARTLAELSREAAAAVERRLRQVPA